MRVIKGETASRTSFQRSAKGNVSIHVSESPIPCLIFDLPKLIVDLPPFQEASPDGKFIVLQNTHRAKDEGVGEWKLKRYEKEKEESHFLQWYSNGMKCDREKGQKRLKGWLVCTIDLSIIGRSMERRKSYTHSLRTSSSVLESNSRWSLISHSISDLWSLDLRP